MNPFAPGEGDPMAPNVAGPTEGGLGADAVEVHMKAMMKAMKAGDASAMARAFKAAHRECMAYDAAGEAEAELEGVV